MSKVQVTLSKGKDTKNTVRYEADKEDQPVSTLYVRKAEAAELGDKVTLTVEKA